MALGVPRISIFPHLFEQVVSVLLEGEVGRAAVVVEAVVHVLQLQHLPDLQRQVLQRGKVKVKYTIYM